MLVPSFSPPAGSGLPVVPYWLASDCQYAARWACFWASVSYSVATWVIVFASLGRRFMYCA